jgi:hypothetical protein
MALPPAVRAVDFESRCPYRSLEHPGYTSWVSFFPGPAGEWYLACEEVTRPDPPLPPCDLEQWLRMGLPMGYDKSAQRLEAVTLVSRDGLHTWQVISRQQFRHHHTAGQFGTARTPDGRFLRFAWSCYALDAAVPAAEILYVSTDDGATWQRQPPFHDPHFVSYPHRLRTLSDGTLVLCLPLSSRWGTPERPLRTCIDLDVPNDLQMTLCFSFDQGRTWQGPLPVFGGQSVSETDFVEMPTGDLLLVNNSIFAHPGRQWVYRQGNRFTPGPLERARGATALGQPNLVPETVCRTADGLLIGCMRPGRYQWSDDLGRTWWPVEGVPDRGPEVYQPWLHALPDGRLACAGHYGRDAPVHGADRDDQYLSLHLFRIAVERPSRETHLRIEREVDRAARRARNAFILTLTCGGLPMPEAPVELWYVERDAPGYDAFGSRGLEERMAEGGTRCRLRTDARGRARVDLSHLDGRGVHHSIQLVARFNADRTDPDHPTCQTCQMEFYTHAVQDPIG